MYEYNICWFSRFGFLGEKYLCNVCICHCIFSVLFWISVCNRYCTRLEFTFGIRALLARDCDKPCYSGRSAVLFFRWKEMASNSKMEIEKFNGKSFELWKLKMEDLLVDRDQWIAVDPGTTPTGTSADDWKKMDRKAKSRIRLCLSDSVLLNVLEEATTKDMGKVGEVVSV